METQPLVKNQNPEFRPFKETEIYQEIQRHINRAKNHFTILIAADAVPHQGSDKLQLMKEYAELIRFIDEIKDVMVKGDIPIEDVLNKKLNMWPD